MNRRTFARRLQENGTTFRALSMPYASMRHACSFTSAVSLEDIANKLGYADVTAFLHAPSGAGQALLPPFGDGKRQRHFGADAGTPEPAAF